MNTVGVCVFYCVSLVSYVSLKSFDVRGYVGVQTKTPNSKWGVVKLWKICMKSNLTQVWIAIWLLLNNKLIGCKLMESKDFFANEQNLNTGEFSTDIESFFTRDNDEKEFKLRELDESKNPSAMHQIVRRSLIKYHK